ncbi:MAG: thioredoxin domain-containing protein [Chitinophagaceae bacterium]
MKKEVAEIIPPKKIIVGDPHAKLLLTEYGDYESEVCAKANNVVKKLLKEFEGKIKFNFRHFPLIKFHQRAHKAAEAAVAASQEGKFWEMHNMLFENRHQLGTISLKEYAKRIQLTDKRFLSRMVDAYYGWTVRGDLIDGLNKGITEVPVFYINDERFNEKLTYMNLSREIEKAIYKIENGEMRSSVLKLKKTQ